MKIFVTALAILACGFHSSRSSNVISSREAESLAASVSAISQQTTTSFRQCASGRVSLKADSGNFLTRCGNCGGAYPDSATVHETTPDVSRSQWSVVVIDSTKIALRGDNDKYLARCNNCYPFGSYPDSAFVHVDDYQNQGHAQWRVFDMGNGRVVLQSDTGSYLARCNNCAPGFPSDRAFVHVTNPNFSWAQWSIVCAPMASENLLGEQLIQLQTVYSFRNRMKQEAQRIWSSGAWTLVSNIEGILNEKKAVSGVFQASGIVVTRARAVVNAPAQRLFDFLVSPQGFQVIDPGSNPADFLKPPLETFPTGNRESLRVESTRTIDPFLPTREFVVLNSVDSQERLFMSKSVRSSKIRGCSIYGPAECAGLGEVVRALNTFALQIESTSTGASTVRLINYVDVGGLPVEISNMIAEPFLHDLVLRIRNATANW